MLIGHMRVIDEDLRAKYGALPTVTYARSQATDNEENFPSRIASSRYKISNLSVSDNELAASVLAAKMAVNVMESMQEFLAKLCLSFITDSQCNRFSQNPVLQIKDRQWPFVTIMFIWVQARRNASDFNSKLHKNIPQQLWMVEW